MLKGYRKKIEKDSNEGVRNQHKQFCIYKFSRGGVAWKKVSRNTTESSSKTSENQMVCEKPSKILKELERAEELQNLSKSPQHETCDQFRANESLNRM